ncbi:phosphatase PAP2 family protein [Pseudoflavitalea sp. X16]|uniref:phosphatase PAP2 family protein n=1 Tax=Paraflavitalea devenefica TaxID=2716334 RepID=UPI00141EC77C|nr:phosphatase PAP2 family protein [Paraflavitalea devenefica]NII26352.1 phosphatase PAP2 family protein [Paraflavitalea devenefica]
MKMFQTTRQSMQVLLFLLTYTLFTFSFSSRTIAQSLDPLEPIGQHYQTQAVLDNAPVDKRAFKDTITFPWTEYSKGALSNALWRTVYLLPEDEARLSSLIRFPANSSEQTKAELEYMLTLQQKRTPKEIQRAQYIANIGSWPNIINPLDSSCAENREQLFYISSTIVGDWFNDKNFPALTDLLLNCIQDTRVTEFRLKRHFKRPRPYHLEPALQPLTRINSPSFPSGHSLWAFTQAFLFSEIIPEKRNEFLKRAEEVRWSREVMGIHFPSDNEASRIISWNLIKYWYNNPQFVADLGKARIEWLTKNKIFTGK